MTPPTAPASFIEIIPTVSESLRRSGRRRATEKSTARRGGRRAARAARAPRSGARRPRRRRRGRRSPVIDDHVPARRRGAARRFASSAGSAPGAAGRADEDEVDGLRRRGPSSADDARAPLLGQRRAASAAPSRARSAAARWPSAGLLRSLRISLDHRMRVQGGRARARARGSGSRAGEPRARCPRRGAARARSSARRTHASVFTYWYSAKRPARWMPRASVNSRIVRTRSVYPVV